MKQIAFTAMNQQQKIPYLEWRDRLSEITSNDMRIDKDLLLISDKTAYSMKHGAFRTDVTTAIIYLQGSVSFRVNMREFSAQAPCMVLLPADTIIECLEVSADAITRIIIMSRTFSDNLFSTQNNILPLYKHVVDNPVIDLRGEEEVMTTFYMMLKNLIRNPQSPWRLEAARHLTLALFYAYSGVKHDVTSTSTKERKDEIYTHFIELLQKHYKQEREIGFYADKLCISPKYLSRMVKEASGRLATEWIEDYVTTESKALLSSTTLSIQQISNALNFPSQSLFGKYFKRITGVTPRNYRKGN